MNYIIIGNGPSGAYAVKSIREYDKDGKITLISREDNEPYSRIMIPELMSGELEDADLYYLGTDFYERHNVMRKLGETVTGIKPGEKKVLLENGESTAFDKLLIATGSSPVPLPIMRNPVEGVFSLWNREDALKLGAFLEKDVNQTVIAGGGLVGLQAARALAKRGRDITVIESQQWLMSAQLDKAAGDMLAQAALKAGIHIITGANVEVFETSHGRITGVQTNRGRFPANLVLTAVGVRPNLDFAAGSGLDMERGLLVNDKMQTNIPGIFAAGDVAQAPGLLEGANILRPLWLCAVKQGKVAGANMAGASLCYDGSLAMNSIDLFGLSIISVGSLKGEGIEEIVICPPGNGVYKKLLFHQNKLMGFILAGDVQQAGTLASRLQQTMGEGYSGAYRNINPVCCYA